MRLKALKLAGFKSFVEPTTIPFPGSLVAVVGPNGCGKSNIIDAVRWVMGESSAKSLRGESMIDVIFNGSSNRKALGQASVELVFDNTLGRLTGPYGEYQEIAIKRVVTRDGESNYYLNGTKCRRRDIVDIFLGTGAGTRGYSIIGQGMISRIIEARPEELRAYFEEAAGVSKYKERKRETLLKMTHTRDNLLRLHDIGDELEKQLQRLERQAASARRYQVLKTDERQCRAFIHALKWQALETQKTEKANEVSALTLELAAHSAEMSRLQKDIIEKKEWLHQAQEEVSITQARAFEQSAEIKRIEMEMAQQAREKMRLVTDLETVKTDLFNATCQRDEDRAALQSIEDLLGVQRQQVEHQQKAYVEHLAMLALKEQAYETNSKDWRVISDRYHALTRDCEVKQMRLTQLQSDKQRLDIRFEKITQEKSAIDLGALQMQKAAALETLAQVQQKVTEESILFDGVQQALIKAKESYQTVEGNLFTIQEQLHNLKGELTALNTMQAASLHKESVHTADNAHASLLTMMRVEKDWQAICEWVLADGLQASLYENRDELVAIGRDLPLSGCYTTSCERQAATLSYSRLSDKVIGILAHWPVSLDKIYAVEDRQQACQLLPQLAPHESVVTKEGYWFGHGWLKILGSKVEEGTGLLARQARISELKDMSDTIQIESLAVHQARETLAKEVQILESQREAVFVQLTESKDHCREVMQLVEGFSHRIMMGSQHQSTLNDELHALLEERETFIEWIITTEENVATLIKQQETLQSTLNESEGMLKESERVLAQFRGQINDTRDACFSVEKEQERLVGRQHQYQTSIERELQRISALDERLESLSEQSFALETPKERVMTLLSEKNSGYRELEQTLFSQKHQLTVESEILVSLEKNHQKEAALLKNLHEKDLALQLEAQALLVKALSIQETLGESGEDLSSVLNELAPHQTQASEEARLGALLDKIHRLGAINLAAIEEYQQESARKIHLDNQYNDLTLALTTLEQAIDKMDKDTKMRLQSTFDEVNTTFQQLFPRLFGGGRAMLTLVGDNLLEAGINIMAQPPGKRNASIHLLSGGEKALTAVALVFAIFQLNPSPFCMLDEVDAPLDDVNVGRFCVLVKEMSQFVQFLFITHNKVTMELAEQLIGVTMREPGVSRIVAVNVEEALSMSES